MKVHVEVNPIVGWLFLALIGAITFFIVNTIQTVWSTDKKADMLETKFGGVEGVIQDYPNLRVEVGKLQTKVDLLFEERAIRKAK